jgi:hypothetical protein
MVAGKLFQTVGLLNEFFFPFRFLLRQIQAATYHEKKQEKNATPLKAMKEQTHISSLLSPFSESGKMVQPD